ncbi:DUF6173 family protein [Cohnella sp.]|uniref:DUF6173 family protein n=1 Tax=Cohnella sp. TaxID=1883426 RepID=UPI003562F30B
MSDPMDPIKKLGEQSMQRDRQLNFKMPKVLEAKDVSSLSVRNYQFADYQYEVIMKSINEFEATLDDNLEVAVQLAAFGQSIVLQVSSIGYSNPSLIHFYGYVNGTKSELIQHVSQLSFLLTTVPKSNPNEPAKRIGFVIGEKDD